MVIVVTLGLKFFTKGMLSISAVLIGLIVGYVYAIAVGMLSLDAITGSGPIPPPSRCRNRSNTVSSSRLPR